MLKILDSVMSLHSLTQSRRIQQVDGQQQTIVFPTCSNPLLRLGLEAVLSGEGFTIWHEAVNDVSTLPDVEDATHVLFVVEGQDDINEVADLAERVRARYPAAKFVMLADNFEMDAVSKAWEAGIHGFCLSSCRRDVLIKSLELVMLGEIVLPPALAISIAQRGADPYDASTSMVGLGNHEGLGSRGRTLSVREAQILECLREGNPNKVIARKLSLSESTVKVHVKAILKKVGVRNRTQAALWATRHISRGAET
jgi:two-component system nitrate/nitrite response regulator NarL